MNCDLSREYMMRYFDGEYNDIQAAHLKQHLKHCRRCRLDFEEMNKVFSNLAIDTEVQPPVDFDAGVMNKIKRFEKKREERNSKVLIVLYNVAVMLSIVLLVVFVGNKYGIGIASDSINEGFGLFKTLYSFVITVANMLYSTCAVIVEKYYLHIVSVITMVVVLQRTFTILVKQNRRGT